MNEFPLVSCGDHSHFDQGDELKHSRKLGNKRAEKS
jgi:hypothetical protein